MELLPEKIKKKLTENGQLENRDKDHAPVVKLFLPGTACTWLLSELDYNDPDIAFGLCDLGMGFPELGSVRISELMSVKAGGIFGIERDTSFEAIYPMSVYSYAANAADMIITDSRPLTIAAQALKKKSYQNKNMIIRPPVMAALFIVISARCNGRAARKSNHRIPVPVQYYHQCVICRPAVRRLLPRSLCCSNSNQFPAWSLVR